jgi:hypothetical protein
MVRLRRREPSDSRVKPALRMIGGGTPVPGVLELEMMFPCGFWITKRSRVSGVRLRMAAGRSSSGREETRPRIVWSRSEMSIVRVMK